MESSRNLWGAALDTRLRMGLIGTAVCLATAVIMVNSGWPVWSRLGLIVPIFFSGMAAYSALHKV